MPPQMVDVGFDFHVWTRNQTSLQSALYDQGWEANFGGADYSDVYVSETQERLTKERFDELRAQPGALSVQAEFIPEEEIVMGIRRHSIHHRERRCGHRRWDRPDR
ncbi:MAG: hypothetical protein MUO50_11230 [Longimicrobiales bacterium]|nr:hypothetical protein [Longimicrobiales bacterium]